MDLYDGNEYRATKDWPYAIAAGSVVYKIDDGIVFVLLLQQSKKRDPSSAGNQEISHHLPKGHAEVTETLHQTALRETEEEGGVHTEICTYLGSINWDIIHPKTNFPVNKAVHYFAAKYVSEAGQKDDEYDETLWVSVDEAEKLLGKPNPKNEDEIIRRFKKYLELTI